MTVNPSRLMITTGFYFMMAPVGGLNLQAAGTAAVGMAQAFAPDKTQVGWIFSAGIFGLLLGALVGGMPTNRHGRKRILLGSVLLSGLFSPIIAVVRSFPTLLLARLPTGIGLGAALPNLIALTSEAVGSRFRDRAVSLMYCGVPIGVVLAAALGFPGLAAAWQTIFWISDVVPLLLIPLLMRWLPESQALQRTEVSVPLRILFAPGHAAAILLSWLGYFFTLLVVYMLINQLPMSLVGQGFRANQATEVMPLLQIGITCGMLLLGALVDKLTPLRMSPLIYSGILVPLLVLGNTSSLNGMLLAGFVAGLFTIGGQSILHALVPLFYPAVTRATGVGTAVVAGRLGAMSGPLLAGKMLILGAGTTEAVATSAPDIVLAGVAVFWLMRRQQYAAMVRNALGGPAKKYQAAILLIHVTWPMIRHHSLTLTVPMACVLHLFNAIPGIHHALLNVYEAVAFSYAELTSVKLMHGNEVHHYQQPLPTRPHADAVFTVVVG